MSLRGCWLLLLKARRKLVFEIITHSLILYIIYIPFNALLLSDMYLT